MATRLNEAEGLYPMTKLMPGDLIEISRRGAISYQHWALYVGHGDVVHLVRESKNANGASSSEKLLGKNKATVTREKLKDVAGKDDYRIHNHLDGQYKPRPIEDILEEANRFLTVGKEVPYYVTTDNCEHFVTLLRYGKPQSQQIQQVGDGAMSYFPTLIAAAVLFGIHTIGTLILKS